MSLCERGNLLGLQKWFTQILHHFFFEQKRNRRQNAMVPTKSVSVRTHQICSNSNLKTKIQCVKKIACSLLATTTLAHTADTLICVQGIRQCDWDHVFSGPSAWISSLVWCLLSDGHFTHFPVVDPCDESHLPVSRISIDQTQHRTPLSEVDPDMTPSSSCPRNTTGWWDPLCLFH